MTIPTLFSALAASLRLHSHAGAKVPALAADHLAELAGAWAFPAVRPAIVASLERVAAAYGRTLPGSPTTAAYRKAAAAVRRVPT